MEIKVTTLPYALPQLRGIVPRRYFSREDLDVERMIGLNARQSRGTVQADFNVYDGDLLGYPSCCVTHYGESRLRLLGGSEDLQTLLAEESKRTNTEPVKL